MYFITRRNTF